jgi:uncharacterized protein
LVQNGAGVVNQDVLARFTASLKRAVNAERVLLFGSRARGHERRDSDYDIIVVSRDFAGQSRRERPVGLYAHWYGAGADAPLDLICLTPQEFDEAAGRISLISAVLPEAVELTDGASSRA